MQALLEVENQGRKQKILFAVCSATKLYYTVVYLYRLERIQMQIRLPYLGVSDCTAIFSKYGTQVV